jgi:hypothetical protein
LARIGDQCSDSQAQFNGVFHKSVVLLIIGATKISAVTFNHGIGFVVARVGLACDLIAETIVPEDPKTGHHTAALD